MRTKTIADITIREEESLDFEDGITRTAYRAYHADGTFLATYWNPPAPPRPGVPGGTWASMWDFEEWIAWARS